MREPSSAVASYTAPDFTASWTNVAGAGSYAVSRGGAVETSPGVWETPNDFVGLGDVAATSLVDDTTPGVEDCFIYLVSSIRTDGLRSIFGKQSNVACR